MLLVNRKRWQSMGSRPELDGAERRLAVPRLGAHELCARSWQVSRANGEENPYLHHGHLRAIGESRYTSLASGLGDWVSHVPSCSGKLHPCRRLR